MEGVSRRPAEPRARASSSASACAWGDGLRLAAALAVPAAAIGYLALPLTAHGPGSTMPTAGLARMLLSGTLEPVAGPRLGLAALLPVLGAALLLATLVLARGVRTAATVCLVSCALPPLATGVAGLGLGPGAWAALAAAVTAGAVITAGAAGGAATLATDRG